MVLSMVSITNVFNFDLLKSFFKNVDKSISIFLINIVISKNIIWQELSELEITVEGGTISIKTIYEAVICSRNIDFILWYHKVVFNAIIKLICAKTKIILKEKEHVYTLKSGHFKIS